MISAGAIVANVGTLDIFLWRTSKDSKILDVLIEAIYEKELVLLQLVDKNLIKTRDVLTRVNDVRSGITQ